MLRRGVSLAHRGVNAAPFLCSPIQIWHDLPDLAVWKIFECIVTMMPEGERQIIRHTVELCKVHAFIIGYQAKFCHKVRGLPYASLVVRRYHDLQSRTMTTSMTEQEFHDLIVTTMRPFRSFVDGILIFHCLGPLTFVHHVCS